MSSKITPIVTGVVLAALTAAVGVQSYYLYRVHEKLEGRPVPAEPAITSSAPAPSATSSPSLQTTAPDPFAVPFDTLAWDPFREMQGMRNRIDALFADSLGRFELDPAFADLTVPRVDLTEDKDEYVVRVDMPGADESSFDVSLDDRSLVVQGDSSEEVEKDEPGQVFRRERTVGHFERRLALPGPVESGSLTSKYSDGVLTIRVHKA